MSTIKTLEHPGFMVAPAACLTARMASTTLDTDVGPENLQSGIEQWQQYVYR